LGDAASDAEASRVEVVRAEGLAGLPHGFLGRRGGVSHGTVAGLNVGLGAGDDGEAVAENRRRAVCAVLPGAQLVTVYQIHSADVVEVTEPWADDRRPQADALVTRRPGLVLGIVTADCAPVLLADREAGVIGAAHAGWRGAHGGVLENTVTAMESLGAKRARLVAAIGPAIAQPSYEVDARFRENFTPADEAFFVAGAVGRWHFDLAGYAAARLEAAGVEQVERLALDTYPLEDRFYSYRRATHRSEPTYGRQFSLIGLPA
jgi:YfiH family protein